MLIESQIQVLAIILACVCMGSYLLDPYTVINSHEYKTGYMNGYTEQNITRYNEYYNVNSNTCLHTSPNMEYIEGYEKGYIDRITEKN